MIKVSNHVERIDGDVVKVAEGSKNLKFRRSKGQAFHLFPHVAQMRLVNVSITERQY